MGKMTVGPYTGEVIERNVRGKESVSLMLGPGLGRRRFRKSGRDDGDHKA